MKLKQIRENLEKQGYCKTQKEFEIEVLTKLMEEYANQPLEHKGKQPGEKQAYELE